MSGVTFDEWRIRTLAVDLLAAGPLVEGRAKLAIAKTAHDGVALAKAMAPWDTGFLSESNSAEIDGLEAEWGPTASYGYNVEHGTSRMAPQPFLGPSLDAVLPGFEKAMEQLGSEVLHG